MSTYQVSLKKLEKQAEQIKEYQLSLVSLSDDQLKAKFLELKQQYENGKISKEDLIKPVYAIVCETAKRVLQKDPYKVQVMGALCLNSGDVASMATGEGKTLTSSLPAVLNAITHKSVHIATSNEYLAERDFDEMGRVYKFLGLSVGLVTRGQTVEEKQHAYACDITYGMGSEFGFDYLRDQLLTNPKLLTGQRHGFAIVDEVDSILIDEATIPMVINTSLNTNVNCYKSADEFVKTLSPSDYEIDPKTKSICLTDDGIVKAEKALSIDFVKNKNVHLMFYVNNALRANYILKKNVDYKVEDGKVLLIDRHSGRVMHGREYSNELQQAIQTKEGVEIAVPSKTIASISFQKYYTKYSKLSGMTGTTENTEDEFLDNYNMFVYKIPTNRPCVRVDEPHRVYATKKQQLDAILQEVLDAQKTGRPVLIGTTTIEQSEEISNLLKQHNIACDVLNANTKTEADIVSCAGKLGKVTIATNVAGRGTDIKLGGDAEKLTILELKKQGIDLSANEETIVFASTFNSTDPKLKHARNVFLNTQTRCKEEKQIVNNLGGLKVISTTLNENERIRRQLIGRSGRQGDNGSSLVMVSLEDPILKRFFSEYIDDIRDEVKRNTDEKGLINNRQVLRLINRTEDSCDALNQSYRKSTIKFEHIIDPIRSYVYKTRTSILKSKKLTEKIEEFSKYCIKAKLSETNDLTEINNYLKSQFGTFCPPVTKAMLENDEDLASTLAKQITLNRTKLLSVLNANPQNKAFLNQVLVTEKNLILKSIDHKWQDFLNAVDDMKQQSFMQCYAQKDPYQDFVFRSSNYFKEIAHQIKEDSVKEIFEKLDKLKILIFQNCNTNQNT